MRGLATFLACCGSGASIGTGVADIATGKPFGLIAFTAGLVGWAAAVVLAAHWRDGAP